MNATSPLASAAPLRRQAAWLLLAMHVPFVVFVVAQAGLGLAYPGPATRVALLLPSSILAAAIQLLHSAAAAAGVRPRYWRLTLTVLTAIAYLPLAVVGTQWTSLQWFVLASLVMLLNGRMAMWVVGVMSIANCIWFGTAQAGPGASTAVLIWSTAYWAAVQTTGVIGLVGAAWLVRLMDQLREARIELADLAASREQLRISRDVHDLLGQSLTAVSLKGDLAIGLLGRSETPRAIAEIESLVGVARTALHDVLYIAHHQPPIALASEIERATDLLGSTGTEIHVDVGVGDLPVSVDELFAWALREGTTNVLRHSNATTCSITIRRHHAVVRLEIINDCAMPMSSGGNGLTGLAARAAALSGVATGRLAGVSDFRLTVDVPEAAA